MGFTKTSSKKANAKRRRRFGREGHSDATRLREAKKRKTEAEVERVKVRATVNRLLARWRANPISGGTNNALSYAGVKTVTGKLAKQLPFRQGSSGFLDLGSGCGIPCIYVALRYGVSCIGVEKDPALVELAREYAQEAGVADLCEFACQDVTQLGSQWFSQSGVTHVMSFDARFGPVALKRLYRVLSRVKSPLVGCIPVET